MAQSSGDESVCGGGGGERASSRDMLPGSSVDRPWEGREGRAQAGLRADLASVMVL